MPNKDDVLEKSVVSIDRIVSSIKREWEQKYYSYLFWVGGFESGPGNGYLVGPDGKRIKYAVRDSDLNVNNPEATDRYYSPVLLRVGDTVFLDSKLKDYLSDEYKNELNSNIIWLKDFRSNLASYRHQRYSGLVLAAIDYVNVKGKKVLDLGSADGVLGFKTLKSGASHVDFVETDSKWENYFWQHVKENDFDEKNVSYNLSDLSSEDFKSKMLSSSKSRGIDLLISNIGPHKMYGTAHFDSLSYADLLDVNTVISGGYTTPISELFGSSVNSLSPAGAIEYLKNIGFKNFSFVKEEESEKYSRLALIARR